MNKSRLFCARTAGRQWMRYFLMLACLLLLIAGRAQTYPVQVTTTLIPPYSPVLSYYTAADANNLQVIIHVMELDRTDLRAKLRVTIEGAGVRLYTSPAYVPPALVLQGGVPEMLSGFDIRGYLNPNNLIFEGITRAEFIKSGKLPEGFYTFTIEVLEYNRSVRISNQSRANAWVVLNDPPLINFPFSGDKLRTTDPQNISFSWVGRHLASPNSAFSTEYEFTLYELYPGQTNPEVAVRSSNSIYRTTTTQSSLYYGPAEPQLIPGKKYAYRIKAYDVSGRDLFKNQGYSETNWFQYGDACLPLRSVTAEALDPSRIRISWEPEATHTGFVVSYREAGTDRWWTETTFSTSLVIPDLKRGTAYEYQVMGQCNQYEGETSTILTISTEEEETEDPNFACGTDLIMPELSPNPLQKPLLPLDLFHIGGLDVVVHSVTLNADGSYSGMGHAPMPIFNGAGMRVKIRNVIINEDYYAIAGSVVTVYDTEGRFIVGNTDDLKGDLSEEDAPEDTTTTDAPDDNLLAVEGDIGNVEVIAGELVVTDVDGNPIDIGTVELPAEGETLTIEDASGDTWVVDAEGNVTPGVGNGGGNMPNGSTENDSVLFVQKELIKEVLEYYREEINLWLENNGKGPLEDVLIRRLMAMPDCLPEDEEQMEAVLAKIEEYLEDPEALLELVKEDDANKARVEELTAKLSGTQPPYAAGLSETEWDQLLEMICPYLVEEEEEERPELVTIEPITDNQFAAGIDDDKLEIKYSIKTTEKYPFQYTKLEVYKNDGTLAYVNSETIEIGEGKIFEWDGRMNQGNHADKYIRYDDGEFTLKVIASINEDFSDLFEAETQSVVFRKTDEFRDNLEVVAYITPPAGVSRFEYYLLLEEELYNIISKNKTDREIIRNFNNGLDYLGEKVNKRTFIGREVMVHDNYWPSLQDIDSKLGSEYDNHMDYTMGGFSIRFQEGSNDAVSNHAYGMALDVKATRNPYLEAPSLYFLQLLTDFKFHQNPSNPEDMKEAHDKLIGFGYQQADITSINAGFEYLNQSSLKTENFETLLNEVFGSYRSAAATFSQLVSRNTHLRNEVHFFNQKTPQEIIEIERQLFEELPVEADALLETIKAVKSAEEINQLYNLYKEGYLKAFLLNKHKEDENTALLVALDDFKDLFGFEAAIASLKEACEQPANGDYTYWVTNVTITQPQSVPEANAYPAVGTFIESRKTDYKEIFTKDGNSYSGIIKLLKNDITSLAQNGFMLMSAEFARKFVDMGGSIISWGGNWKGKKDFMHMEYIEKERFTDK